MNPDVFDELSEILLEKDKNFNRCIVMIDKLFKGYEEERELNVLLCQRIVELKARIVELESRPPDEGGEIYKQAKEHFTLSHNS